MKNPFVFFAICSLFLIITGCKYNCPGFDEKLLSWMPYEENDTITYISQQNDTITFQINKYSVSNSYETTRKNRDYCASDASFYTIDNEGKVCGVGTWISMDNNKTNINVSVNINNNKGEIDKTVKNITDAVETLSINGKQYDEVLIFEQDTIKQDDEIWKIILANNYGIIQFYDRVTGYIWTLQHD